MSSGQTIYCFDTSALLDAWARWYPIDLFPSLWTNFDGLIRSNRAIAPDEVLLEVERKEDGLHRWLKSRGFMFVPLDTQIQSAATDILTSFPKLVDERRDRSRADPFVIALAQTKGCTVVTGEKASGTANRPRIPNVCQHFKIPWQGIVQVIRQQRWTF